METDKEFINEELELALAENEDILETGLLPLDDCLKAMNLLAKGASRATAQVIADLGYLDTEQLPVEAFTVAPSSLNQNVCMLGLIDVLVDTVTALARAVWKVISAIIRAITFPFRWALGMTGGSSGGGGGGGGGSALSAKAPAAAKRIERRTQEIKKRMEESGFADVPSTFTTEKYLATLAKDGIDETGIGSMLNYLGTLHRAQYSIPPGIQDALMNRNTILSALGVNAGTTGSGDMQSGIWWTRTWLVAMTTMPDMITNRLNKTLFGTELRNHFTQFEGSGDTTVMTGFHGTREDAVDLYYGLVGGKPSNPYVGPMAPSKDFFNNTRLAQFQTYLAADEGRGIPILQRISQHLAQVPIEEMISTTSHLASAFEEFKNDDFWEYVRKEIVRLKLPSPKETENASSEIDLLKNLQDPSFRETISTLWTSLDAHVFTQGNAKTSGVDFPPSQLADLDVMRSSPILRGSSDIIGVNFAKLSLDRRKEYGLDDKRIGDVLAGELPGGMISEPANTSQAAYLMRTLDNLGSELAAKGWKRESDAFKGLSALVKDNINAQTKIMAFASLVQTMHMSLVAAAWFGLNEWLLNVQDAYISIMAYSLVHHSHPKRIMDDVEAIIERKLTDAEKTLITQDIANSSKGDIQPPSTALAVIFAAKSDDGTADYEHIKRVMGFVTDYMDKVKESHTVINKTLNIYMGLNRKSDDYKKQATTIEEIMKIINQQPIGKIERRSRPPRGKMLRYKMFDPAWSKAPKLPEGLKEWLTNANKNNMPFIVDEETTEQVRHTHRETEELSLLKLRIYAREYELLDRTDTESKDYKAATMDLNAMRQDLRELYARRTGSSKATGVRHR